MNALKNIIVTGSNKGIGYGVVENLASKAGWNIVMAVRNIELGEKAKTEIATKYPQAHLKVEKLDVSDAKSIEDFVAAVKAKYGEIHVLVNNAAVAAKGDAFDSEVVQFTLQTNFYGTIDLTEKLLPLITNGGKIVTIGSASGIIIFRKMTNETLKSRLQNPSLTKKGLFDIIHDFEAAVANKTYAEQGWPKWSYAVSKLGIHIYNRILSQSEDVLTRRIQIYICCPGHVKTDMSSHQGKITVQEGVKTPVYLIELPFELNHERQGGFFYKERLAKL